MRTALGALLIFLVVCPSIGHAVPQAKKVPQVPASGRSIEVITTAPVAASADEKERSGKLTFKDRNGGEHYCTAQLVNAFDAQGGGTDPNKATLLLTAAHCARAGFTDFSFTYITSSGSQTVVPECVTRNTKWIDPDGLGAPVDPFINIRFDYAFLRLPTTGTPITPHYKINWSGDWSDNSFNNKHILEENISVLGITAAGTLSKLAAGYVQMRPDFYHPKLNSLSMSDLSFSFGTSWGAWLEAVTAANPTSKIISIISSIAKTSNTGVTDYATLYGPILHDDARKLADYTEKSTNVILGECKP